MQSSSLAADFTREEQIGQVLMVGFPGHTPSPEIIDLIEHHYIGGVILFSRNVQDAAQLLKLTDDLQSIAKAAGHRYPLLISIDQENGVVRRLGKGATIFPGNMGLGAIGSEQVTYDVARATGRELKALGVNMNLAPVVDVNNNPANPIVGVRSFGEDPEMVGRLAAAAVRGYRDAGVITSIKHFPGHGDTAVDSHLDLPVVPHDLDRLNAVELMPFRSAIAAGADSVMIAHMALPHLMPRSDLPSTVSPEIVEGLLRDRLGYRGVTVSDCMEMRAISDTIGTEQGTAMAIQAGVDLVLVSHRYDQQRGSIEAVKKAVHSGALPAERLRQAAERVLELKARYLSWQSLPDSEIPDWVDGPEHRALAERAYAELITVICDQSRLLPLRLDPTQRLLVLYPQREELTFAEDNRFPHGFLAESASRRHVNLDALAVSHTLADTDRDEILRRAAAADLILMATNNAHLFREQAYLMRRLLESNRPIVGLLVRDPYDLLMFPGLQTCVAAYEYTPPAIEAAMRIIFGEQPARGRLPVSLPGLYERGTGVVTNVPVADH